MCHRNTERTIKYTVYVRWRNATIHRTLYGNISRDATAVFHVKCDGRIKIGLSRHSNTCGRKFRPRMQNDKVSLSKRNNCGVKTIYAPGFVAGYHFIRVHTIRKRLIQNEENKMQKYRCEQSADIDMVGTGSEKKKKSYDTIKKHCDLRVC